MRFIERIIMGVEERVGTRVILFDEFVQILGCNFTLDRWNSLVNHCLVSVVTWPHHLAVMLI